MSKYLSFTRRFARFNGIYRETPENLNYRLYVKTVNGFP